MTKKLKEILPGIIISLIISLTTSLIVFSSTFSSLQANVIFNTEQLKTKVNKEQFDAILRGQDKMVETIEKRLNKIEDKLDRAIEKDRK